eukprot:XP_001706434.1 Hypothetical protein GL50803_37962 [Giardia lamblia ATCC 50803]
MVVFKDICVSETCEIQVLCQQFVHIHQTMLNAAHFCVFIIRREERHSYVATDIIVCHIRIEPEILVSYR